MARIASPDGYRFVLGGTGTFAANQALYRNPVYNTLTDFNPVVLIAEQPMALIARNDLPAGKLHTLRDRVVTPYDFQSYGQATLF